MAMVGDKTTTNNGKKPMKILKNMTMVGDKTNKSMTNKVGKTMKNSTLLQTLKMLAGKMMKNSTLPQTLKMLVGKMTMNSTLPPLTMTMLVGKMTMNSTLPPLTMTMLVGKMRKMLKIKMVLQLPMVMKMLGKLKKWTIMVRSICSYYSSAICEKTTRNKSASQLFLKITSKQCGDFFQIFVAFSEYLNFTWIDVGAIAQNYFLSVQLTGIFYHLQSFILLP